MGLPNATSLLTNIPAGMRATMRRGSTVASLAVRTASNEAGELSPQGLKDAASINVWFLSADFSPPVRNGDTLTIDGVQALVVDRLVTCGGAITRVNALQSQDLAKGVRA